jgi:predicted ATPase/DNA-binding XRE family transcriptional regulator
MRSSLPNTFGDLLRRHRQAAGLTQLELAERAGLSVHGIQKLERGASHPYRDTAQRLIVALRLEADDQTRFRAAVVPVRRHRSVLFAETDDDVRHNLPVPMTSLVGREDAIDEVRRRLADTRILTLTGVGGCGKTRLAVEVARSVIEGYADGVWLVELGPLFDSAVVAQRVAAVVRVRETAEQPLVTTLANALRHRNTLLVLDNCEHLLDACSQLVDSLLRACPEVRVLATSREPIGIGGEAVWRVPSLALPEADSATTPEQLLLNPAMQLFVQRASAAQPRFALTARNAAAVAQICRRLDGIPLGLELAAARVEALTAEQIALRLDQRFRLLNLGSRAALPRQQTLAATLDWSYDLLRKPERLLFERLAVFSGGWTLEAAEAVCAGDGLDDEDVLDVLANLTRKSLVVAEEVMDGAERYSLLETLCDYARTRLAARGAAEITKLRDRHANFFSSLVEQLLPDELGRLSAEIAGQRVGSLSRVDAESDNLHSALAWCLESGQPARGIRLATRLSGIWLQQRGRFAEVRRWLGDLLELNERTIRDRSGPSLDAPLREDVITLADRANAIEALGTSAAFQGDYLEARARHDEAAAIWRELAVDLSLGLSLAETGATAWVLGESARAINLLEESRRVLDRCERTPVSITYGAVALRNLGMVARHQGDYVRAAEYFRESVIQARFGIGLGGYNAARGLSHLGRTLFLQGDVAHAKQAFSEALGLMHEERLAGHAVADCLDWLAAIADADGRPREAAILFGAADAHWEASGAVRYAPEQATYNAELSSVQAKLSASEFTSAWKEGRAMNRAQAVAYALEQIGAQETDAAPPGARREFKV